MKFSPPFVSLCCALSLATIGCSSPRSASSGTKPLDSARLQLLEATITHDETAIQPLLAPDFTWREDDAPLTETAFSFWDRQKLWGILHDLLEEKLTNKGDTKVAPRKALDEGYSGPRLAWRKVGAEWKLAYFYAGTSPTTPSR